MSHYNRHKTSLTCLLKTEMGRKPGLLERKVKTEKWVRSSTEMNRVTLNNRTFHRVLHPKLKGKINGREDAGFCGFLVLGLVDCEWKAFALFGADDCLFYQSLHVKSDIELAIVHTQ